MGWWLAGYTLDYPVEFILYVIRNTPFVSHSVVRRVRRMLILVPGSEVTPALLAVPRGKLVRAGGHVADAVADHPDREEGRAHQKLPGSRREVGVNVSGYKRNERRGGGHLAAEKGEMGHAEAGVRGGDTLYWVLSAGVML